VYSVRRSPRILALPLLGIVATAICALVGAVLVSPPEVTRRNWVTVGPSRVVLLLSGSGACRARHCVATQTEPDKADRDALIQRWWSEFLPTVPGPATYDGFEPRAKDYRARLDRIDAAFSGIPKEPTPRELPLLSGLLGVLSPTDPSTLPDLLIVDTAGWPFASLRCETRLTALVATPPYFSEEIKGGAVTGDGVHAVLIASAPLASYHTIPLGVHWPGFLASVAAWTGMVAFAVISIRALRRTLSRGASAGPTPEGGRVASDTG
jgi:hypothetical protein